MDCYDGKVLNKNWDLKWAEPVRKSMGHALSWSRRVNLAAMTPRSDLASSKYCLANPGREYLIYLPEGKEAAVDLSGSAGSYAVEWFDPATGETRKSASVQSGGSVRLVSPLASKDAVLHLVRSTP
jgi:hypothetical protein